MRAGQPSLSLTIPADWPSGVYALHLEGAGWKDNIPFYVRATKPGARARVAFLAPTFSYTIYGNFARPGRQAALGRARRGLGRAAAVAGRPSRNTASPPTTGTPTAAASPMPPCAGR